MDLPSRSLLIFLFALCVRCCSAIAATTSCPLEPQPYADVKSKATVYQVAGDSLDNDNILGAEEVCTLEEFSVDGVSGQFNYTVPQYSATVIRIAK